MHRRPWPLMWGVWLLVAVAAWPVAAGELLPPEREIPAVIDQYLDAKLAAAKVAPAPGADDATILRRTMLDLVGRVPTASEAQAYLAATDPNKREQLVDRLLSSPGYVRHQTNEFDRMLAGQSGKGNLREYLQAAVSENRAWDKIFRELLSGKDSEIISDGKPRKNGASQFLRSRASDLDRLANETSVIFFGVNISCAKCHDHPLVPEWTQEHFYGMASFFNRTFENDGYVGERDYGLVKYTTTSGENRTARLMFLTGKVLDEPQSSEPNNDERKKEKERLEEAKKKKEPPPEPKFSRRAQLAEVALAPESRHFFAKSLVNQLWHRYFGHGLVMPLDQMHDANPPSHPDLLEWLARDFAEHGYDIKRLTRGLVLSRAYARSSRWDQGERPAPDLFAVASVKPLTPAQYAAVLGIANASPAQFPPDMKPEELEQRVRSVEGAARGALEKLEAPGEGYQVSVDEALLLSNNERIQRDVLRNSNDSLLGKLKDAPDRRAAIEMAVWNTLNRAPAADEVPLLENYLTQRGDRLDDAWRQLVWALLTSSEARFNH